MRVRPIVAGRMGSLGQSRRFLRRIKEHELAERWHSSKAKKDETLGKRAELELRRRFGGSREYHQIKESRRKERELSKMAKRFRRFIMRMVPLPEGPRHGVREGVT
jgi:hypothetical protein